MLTRLIHHSLASNRERTILAQDLKDEADESVRKIVEHTVSEADGRHGGRLQLPVGVAVVWNPPSS
jgi:hypothetical protein